MAIVSAASSWCVVKYGEVCDGDRYRAGTSTWLHELFRPTCNYRTPTNAVRRQQCMIGGVSSPHKGPTHCSHSLPCALVRLDGRTDLLDAGICSDEFAADEFALVGVLARLLPTLC
eukprot:2441347-Prymnesium_polylepis.1